MEKAIIGGTGVYSVYETKEMLDVETKYGNVEITVLDVDGEEIAFLPRHGKDHSTPPHAINYRANMMALQQIGVKYVYGLVTSGSLVTEVPVGSIVVIDDFIDFTIGREETFFDGEDNRVVHTDMGEPYCNQMRNIFIECAKENNVDIIDNGVYVCFKGPRFETKAEIRMFNMLGGTLIGMTNIPEVVLAKELGLCYSAIGLISNMGCGMQEQSVSSVNHGEVITDAKNDTIKIIFDAFKSKKFTQDDCVCTTSTIEL